MIKRSLAALAVITFAISYASVYILEPLNHSYYFGSIPAWLRHVTFTWDDWNYNIWIYTEKWTMGPLRILLFLLWFTVLYWIVHKYEQQIGRATRGLLELLGRNSLFVYVAHAFVVFVLKMYVIPPTTSVAQNFLITGSAIAILILVTIAYKKLEVRISSRGFTKLKLNISQVFNR